MLQLQSLAKCCGHIWRFLFPGLTRIGASLAIYLSNPHPQVCHVYYFTAPEQVGRQEIGKKILADWMWQILITAPHRSQIEVFDRLLTACHFNRKNRHVLVLNLNQAMADIQQSFPIVKNMTWLPLIVKKMIALPRWIKEKQKLKSTTKQTENIGYVRQVLVSISFWLNDLKCKVLLFYKCVHFGEFQRCLSYF